MTESLSIRIRALREKAAFSQQQVADAVGVSRVAVTKWESGDTKNLKFDNLVALLKLFKVSFDELVASTAVSRHAMEARRLLDELKSDVDRDKALHALGVVVAELRPPPKPNGLPPDEADDQPPNTPPRRH